MENLKKFDATVILSKKQIYLMQLYSGCNKQDAEYIAKTFTANKNDCQNEFKNFDHLSGYANDLNVVLKLGFKVLSEIYREELNEEDQFFSEIEKK